MKQLFFAVMALFAVHLATQAQETADKQTKVKDKPNKVKIKGEGVGMGTQNYPYPVTYSSNFTMGNPAQAKMVLDLMKGYENNDFSAEAMFADTVTVITPDGTVTKGKDKMLAMFKQQRAAQSDVKFTITAVVPLRSIDKNQDWVAIWGTQNYTANGTKMATDFQDIWGLNKDGKVVYMQIFEGKSPPMQ